MAVEPEGEQGSGGGGAHVPPPGGSEPAPTVPVPVKADAPAPADHGDAVAGAGANGAQAAADNFSLVVGKATDSFDLWQQVPAWVLGIAAIAGGGFLIAFPDNLDHTQTADAWAAVIVALILAVVLSYRSAFTLTADKPPKDQPAEPGNGK